MTDDAALLSNPNPFAPLTAAHLYTRRTRQSPAARFDAKRRLLRLLNRRFGPLSADVTRRLAQSTPEQLEIWAERVLDARTIDEVFAEN